MVQDTTGEGAVPPTVSLMVQDTTGEGAVPTTVSLMVQDTTGEGAVPTLWSNVRLNTAAAIFARCGSSISHRHLRAASKQGHVCCDAEAKYTGYGN
uniref:Uncharacterized protein n=1 Tax=Peronospora matthiolae TaxID=2874970 RepID=A0AAV1UMW6_9STRA